MTSHETPTAIRSDQLTLAILVLILLTAVVLRAFSAVVVDRYVQAEGRSFLVEGDANGYWELAEKLANGDEYAIHQPPRYVLRVPGFPLLLAASIKVFGNSILAARLILALVGTICCFLVFVLAKQLTNRTAGLVAAGFLAIHPLQIGNSVLILSETWFTFWMLLSLIALAAFLKTFADLGSPQPAPPNLFDRLTSTAIGPRRSALLTGILVGTAVLVRPGFLPWIGFCVLATFACRSRSWAARFSQSAILVFGCLLVMMPWALRNQSATGHFVLTSLWSGPSLYDGLNPDATGASDMTFFDDDHVMDTMSEYEMNHHYSERAIQFALQNPLRAITLGFRKAGLYLSPVPNIAGKAGWVAGGLCVAFWAVMFFGAILGVRVVFGGGVRSAFRNGATVLLLSLGPFLLFLLVHLVFVGSVRYRLPVEFPLSILSAVGWVALVFGNTLESSLKPQIGDDSRSNQSEGTVSK